VLDDWFIQPNIDACLNAHCSLLQIDIYDVYHLQTQMPAMVPCLLGRLVWGYCHDLLGKASMLLTHNQPTFIRAGAC
jgi:hypothetical protein